METPSEVHRQERTQRVTAASSLPLQGGQFQTFGPSAQHAGSTCVHSSVGICASRHPKHTTAVGEAAVPAAEQGPPQRPGRHLTSVAQAPSHLQGCSFPSCPVSAIFQPCSFSFHHLISQLGLTLAHTPLNFNQPTAEFSIFFLLSLHKLSPTASATAILLHGLTHRCTLTTPPLS